MIGANSRFKILGPNLALDATWTSLTSVPSLPASHLALERRGRICRTTSAAAQWFKAQLPVAQAVGGYALLDANLAAGVTITVEANAIDAWPGLFTDAALVTWAPGRGGVLPRFFPAAQSYPWWRWSIDNPANPSGYLQLKLVFGRVWDLGEGPAPGSFQDVDPSLTTWSPGGSPSTFALPLRRRLVIPVNALAPEIVYGDELDALIEAVGTKHDVVCSLYGDAPDQDAVAIKSNRYGRFTELPEFVLEAPYYRGAFDFREVR